jgi:hypothetical protein
MSEIVGSPPRLPRELHQFVWTMKMLVPRIGPEDLIASRLLHYKC